MRRAIPILLITVVMMACGGETEPQANEGQGTNGKTTQAQQLNITILLDLSDRVIQDMEPSQSERDIAVVKNILKIVKENMKKKGAHSSKDKIRVLFNPAPSDPNINNIAKNLSEDFSKKTNPEKREILPKIEDDFENALREIYELTLKSEEWNGSDIWRFFKYDAKDFCIDSDTSYKNILVIITDGYIYHDQSVDRQDNRTTYITPKYLSEEGFRNDADWNEKFESGDYGLINSGQAYENLNILVLEVNPSQKHVNDEDIIRAFLGKWFEEMKVKADWRIYNTDLPENTEKRLENFFK